MNKVSLVKGITKLYFAGALAGSATHIITASHKMGGTGIEAMVTPLMIDGIAIIGMVMRSEDFSKRTNKIGFIVQCVMGAMSLAMNVAAAHNFFGVVFGIAIVSLFIFSEWLGDQIEAREVDEKDAKAQQAAAAAAALAASVAWMAACNHPKQCGSEVQCETKKASTAKAARTRKQTAKTRKVQAEALQSLLDTPVVDDHRVTVLRAA
jgi:hypothetical protein